MMSRFLLSLALTSLLAGCGPYRHDKPAPDASAGSVVEPKRTRRGNPPFYEVMGQRYYVSASSDGYRERGVASWYGKQFHGLPTASGEIYDMHQLTAAHKTLPIPTWVEVTNLSNGETVIVKVNDRGPFIDKRIIDLSFAAAQKLGMVRAGTSLVEVRALGAPAVTPDRVTARPTPAPETATTMAVQPPPAPSVASTEPLYLQVGAFGDPVNAQRLVNQLQGAGFDDVFTIAATDRTPVLHRVRIGPIASVARFDNLMGRLAELGFSEARLVTLY
jgi:rare lipoprotein A